MQIKRRKTKIINIGGVKIGGNQPIAIQAMTKTATADVLATVRQIKILKAAGCEIVRCAVKDILDARAIKKIKQSVDVPLVADIHFDYRLGLEAIKNGADKIRLNPGNIYKKDQIKAIIEAAKKAHIPIRVGVNSGSLRSKVFSVDNMVKSAVDYIKILEGFKFYDIVLSLKASNIFDTIEAYRKMAKLCDYPLHLGVTATGVSGEGAIKSSIAIGALLLEGIGDTIRISLTDNPEEEVKVAKYILESLGLRRFGPEVISCPTCGRCEVDLVGIVKELENELATSNSRFTKMPIKMAVMGCLVNGPGEAKEADLGIAFGSQEALLFKNGKPLKKVNYKNCLRELLKQLKRAK